MVESSLITDELKNLIGVPWEPQIFKIEEGAIKRYAEAIDDPNPLYGDEEYGRNSKYGSIIGPPSFFGWKTKWAESEALYADPRDELDSALVKAGFETLVETG